MLGILLLYWIGKYYYKLAEAHDKSKWGYAILGIVMYYASVVVSGLLLGIVIELIWPGAVDTINELLLSILVLPFGIAGTYLLYHYFRRNWQSKAPQLGVEELGAGEPTEMTS